MLFEVGSLNIYFSIFAIGTPLSCMRFFISAALSSARSIACCHRFLVFKALSAAFSWSFYIFLPSKGDSWNAGSLKTECLLQTRSLSNTLLFVASP